LIAQARDSYEIGAVFPERLSQHGHLHPQICFIDRNVRPCPFKQLGFRNKLSRSFEKRTKNRIRTAAEHNALIVAPKYLALNIKTEGAKSHAGISR
jgi:hypothetical protein